MKKILFILAAVCVLAVYPASAVLAADTAENKSGNGVTITVVMPVKEPEPPVEQEPLPISEIKIYPVDVSETRENGGRQIIKTYELTAIENPADIPRGNFERNGWTYALSDILRRETANAETREHTETVTLNTDTKELEQIMAQLAPTMEYKAEDEFAGFLRLDVASIKVESAGTKTTSFTKTVTREYPRLSSSDTSLVPKTVEDRGKSYTLAGVDWKAGYYETVDYEQIPEYYTAVASYTATGYSTKVTGYVTTAEYKGSLAKLSQGKTVYTAYFEGKEIRTPLELDDEPVPCKPNAEPTEHSVPCKSAQPVSCESVTETMEQSAPCEFVADAAKQSAPAPMTVPAKTPNPVETDSPAETSAPYATPVPTETPEPTATPVAAVAASSESNGENTELYVIIALMILLLIGCALDIFINRKGKTHNEKTSGSSANARSDDDGGDSGNGR